MYKEVLNNSVLPIVVTTIFDTSTFWSISENIKMKVRPGHFSHSRTDCWFIQRKITSLQNKLVRSFYVLEPQFLCSFVSLFLATVTSPVIFWIGSMLPLRVLCMVYSLTCIRFLLRCCLTCEICQITLLTLKSHPTAHCCLSTFFYFLS